MNYGFRSISGLILCSIFLAVFARELIKKHESNKISSAENSAQAEKLVALLLFYHFLLHQPPTHLSFPDGLKILKSEARKASSWTHIDEVMPADGCYSDFSWAWTNPSLSIILRGNSAGVI